MTAIKILICDLIGLRFDGSGRPDFSEAKAHAEARGGVFHDGPLDSATALEPGKLHFFYQPDLSTREELLEVAGGGQYDAVIAAATFMPQETIFPLGGVRIGAGTGNMGSASWGGGSGVGGTAPLMNTPGINSQATAQMAMKALLKVRPDLPVDELHRLVATGDFDTGKQLRDFPTEKLEGKRLAIIGYGNIGRELAKLGRAFGMNVVIHARDRHREWIEREGFDYAPTIVEAARDADALSVHVGLGAFDETTQRYANAGLIGEDVLQALNSGAVLINYDRGELVDVSALHKALASGRVAHAAIDADLFKDQATGFLSGPMLPYLALIERFGDRLELLPHAAADTDHPSRVAGAKQAIDQIFETVLNRRILNLKGTLPDGFENGGAQLPNGIGPVTDNLISAIAANHDTAAQLASLGRAFAAFWEPLSKVPSDLDRQALVSSGAREMIVAANQLSRLLRELGLDSFYSEDH
jgi:lactate dehydrogenase-like 2-hydroxyacid dehydrogenase